MRTGVTLTATLRWPFRVTHVGTSARLGPVVITAADAERFRLAGVKPGETDIAATFPDTAPGAPAGALLVVVTVRG